MILVALLAAASYGARLVETDEQITGVSATTPIAIVTEGEHGFSTGDHVRISGVQGVDAANGTWEITTVGERRFTLDESRGEGTYRSGGTASSADLLYRWETAIGGLIQYAIILVLVLALVRGLAPAALGLKRPHSWSGAVGKILLALVGIWIVGFLLNFVLEAGEEQGLVPDGWDPDRAAPFVANFVVVALVAPVVEELTYRGLGLAAVRDAFGVVAAIAVTAIAFGLAHGLLVALPVLIVFGAILAWLRLSTDSLYPPIALHAIFNGAALIAAVSV